MIITLVEWDGGGLSPASVSALTFVRGLTAATGESMAAVVFCEPDGSLGGITGELASHGVSTLHVIEHDRCGAYEPACWGEALSQLLRRCSPEGVVASATDRGNELMAHVAARMCLPLAAGCTTVTAGDPWKLTRQRSGGVLLEDAELAAPIKLITVAAGVTETPTAQPASGVGVQKFVPRLDDTPEHSRVVGHTAREPGVSLATAAVVVSGGRGVGSAEGFAPLEELAKLVDGAVGCSRVATNNGWRSHRDQVGLTGTKIAPALYIACGISGASQHWVGCMDAKRILAINTDSEAPMVARATYAVIGDVHEVLGAVLDELKKRRTGAA